MLYGSSRFELSKKNRSDVYVITRMYANTRRSHTLLGSQFHRLFCLRIEVPSLFFFLQVFQVSEKKAYIEFFYRNLRRIKSKLNLYSILRSVHTASKHSHAKSKQKSLQ